MVKCQTSTVSSFKSNPLRIYLLQVSNKDTKTAYNHLTLKWLIRQYLTPKWSIKRLPTSNLLGKFSV